MSIKEEEKNPNRLNCLDCQRRIKFFSVFWLNETVANSILKLDQVEMSNSLECNRNIKNQVMTSPHSIHHSQSIWQSEMHAQNHLKQEMWYFSICICGLFTRNSSQNCRRLSWNWIDATFFDSPIRPSSLPHLQQHTKIDDCIQDNEKGMVAIDGSFTCT